MLEKICFSVTIDVVQLCIRMYQMMNVQPLSGGTCIFRGGNHE